MSTSDDEARLLRSVALQNASSILIARQRAEQRQEAYLAEAQRLSQTGSFGWRVATGDIVWSEETYRIFQYDRTTTPTVESMLQRVHPEDAALVRQILDRASQDGKDFDFEYRLLMPDGSVKHVHVVAHALRDESGTIEFVGAVMDVTGSKRAEEALRRSESYLAEAQTLTHTGSWAFNAITTLYWSEENFRIWGFDPQQGLPRRGTMLQRIHPEDRGRVVEDVQNAVRERRDYAIEFRIVLPNGAVRCIHGLGHTAFSASGELVEVVGTNVDVTDRKRAEALLAGEKRLLEMIARGDALALILEAVCRLVEELVTGSLSSILLLDPNGSRLRHGAAPSLPISYTEAIDGVVIGPSVGSCGTAAYRAKQVVVSDIATDPLWANFRDLALAHGLRACWSTPMFSSAGRVLGTFAVYYREPHSPTPQELDDIEQVTHLASIAVERKQAEEALRERASLLDLTHDSIFVRDMRDVITYWNSGAAELYGWSKEEALHKVSHRLTQTVFPAPLAEINAELLRTGRWEGELIHTKRDGKQVVVVSRWSLQRDEDGLPVAILETNNDITKRKQSEEAVLQAQAQLAHATRIASLGELTASIAHEVNQPLAGVVSSGNACMRWLASEPPNIEKARQSVDRIIRDANRASEVVAGVRGLAKKAPVQKVWLNINETILETMALVRMEAAKHHASLKTRLSNDIPLAWADRIQLQQVVLNLIINALEAVSAVSYGPRDLFVSTAKHESDGVLLTVRDSGTGLDPENLERIFDAFYTTKREGMGMGLAVSRSIIEAHGGHLWASANEPRGAVFQFTLPAGREEAS